MCESGAGSLSKQSILLLMLPFQTIVCGAWRAQPADNGDTGRNAGALPASTAIGMLHAGSCSVDANGLYASAGGFCRAIGYWLAWI